MCFDTVGWAAGRASIKQAAVIHSDPVLGYQVQTGVTREEKGGKQKLKVVK